MRGFLYEVTLPSLGVQRSKATSFCLDTKRGKKLKSGSYLAVAYCKNDNHLRNSAHLKSHWDFRLASDSPRFTRLSFVQYSSRRDRKGRPRPLKNLGELGYLEVLARQKVRFVCW